MQQLFVDLDGVFADFNELYVRLFGEFGAQRDDPEPPGMWKNIREHGTFYKDLPLKPDALELWNGVQHLNPIILTGVPYDKVPGAEAHKREWLKKHLGANVRVVCCSANLRNWLGFLTLRMSEDAQWEIRQYANTVARIVEARFPRTYELFASGR